MGEIKFIGALLLIVVFAIAVVGYTINFADDNNAVISLEDDSEFSSLDTTLDTGVTSFSSDSNSSSKAFAESTIASGDETTVTGGQFKVGFGSLFTAVKGTFTTIRSKIFGGSTALGIFLTALSGFLVYMGFRYVWKTWKGGNPD